MSCGGEEGDYRYRVAVQRNDLTMEGKVLEFFGEVGVNVNALLEHLAKPGDRVVVEVFREEDE